MESIVRITEELNALLKEIEDAKTEKARAEGQLEAMMTRLKQRGIEDEEALEDKIAELDEERVVRRQKIEEGWTKLRNSYEW